MCIRDRHAVGRIRRRDVIDLRQQRFLCVAHDVSVAEFLQHFQIILAVAEAQHFLVRQAPRFAKLPQRRRFGNHAVRHFDHVPVNDADLEIRRSPRPIRQSRPGIINFNFITGAKLFPWLRRQTQKSMFLRKQRRIRQPPDQRFHPLPVGLRITAPDAVFHRRHSQNSLLLNFMKHGLRLPGLHRPALCQLSLAVVNQRTV